MWEHGIGRIGIIVVFVNGSLNRPGFITHRLVSYPDIHACFLDGKKIWNSCWNNTEISMWGNCLLGAAILLSVLVLLSIRPAPSRQAHPHPKPLASSHSKWGTFHRLPPSSTWIDTAVVAYYTQVEFYTHGPCRHNTSHKNSFIHLLIIITFIM